MNKVFLGGTCAGTTWRDDIIKHLTVPYFNPVVEDWTTECQAIEELEKRRCNVHLYVITHEMIGVFSIAEAIESTLSVGNETILQVIPRGFGQPQLKSLQAVVDMVNKHGGVGRITPDLKMTAMVINKGMGS